LTSLFLLAPERNTICEEFNFGRLTIKTQFFLSNNLANSRKAFCLDDLKGSIN